MTPYCRISNSQGKGEEVNSSSGCIIVFVFVLEKGRVLGLDMQLNQASEQGSGGVGVRYPTVASALRHRNPVVNLSIFLTNVQGNLNSDIN